MLSDGQSNAKGPYNFLIFGSICKLLSCIICWLRLNCISFSVSHFSFDRVIDGHFFLDSPLINNRQNIHTFLWRNGFKPKMWKRRKKRERKNHFKRWRGRERKKKKIIDWNPKKQLKKLCPFWTVAPSTIYLIIGGACRVILW